MYLRGSPTTELKRGSSDVSDGMTITQGKVPNSFSLGIESFVLLDTVPLYCHALLLGYSNWGCHRHNLSTRRNHHLLTCGWRSLWHGVTTRHVDELASLNRRAVSSSDSRSWIAYSVDSSD